MNNGPSYSTFTLPWLTIFILVKLLGTAFATWSWWWVLLPSIPCLVVFLQKLGMI